MPTCLIAPPTVCELQQRAPHTVIVDSCVLAARYHLVIQNVRVSRDSSLCIELDPRC